MPAGIFCGANEVLGHHVRGAARQSAQEIRPRLVMVWVVVQFTEQDDIGLLKEREQRRLIRFGALDLKGCWDCSLPR